MTQTSKSSPDRATLRRAVKGLRRELKKHPNDLKSMVRVARAFRLLGEKKSSAAWYKRAIGGFLEQGQSLRALALAKELLSVAPGNQSILEKIARIHARHHYSDPVSRRILTPIEGSETAAQSDVLPCVPLAASKDLSLLDDAAQIEDMEPSITDSSPAPFEKKHEVMGRPITSFVPISSSSRAIPEHQEEGTSIPDPRLPPPPPPEAFLVAEEYDEEKRSSLLSDPAWSNGDLNEADSRDSGVSPREESVGGLPLEPDALPAAPSGHVLEQARMGELPLLSSLGENAFVTISRAMRPVALRDGEILFRANDEARSFFVIAQGTIEARIESGGEHRLLAELGEGEVIGLFGLYTGRKRNATAIAKGPTVVFEITDQILARLVREHPASKQPLGLFYRRRLLEISLGRSPLFRDLAREKRLAIVDQFQQRRLEARETVIAPGHVTLGLFLVMRGQVLIETRESGRVITKARLGRGDFFGCISALTGMPTLASATCREESVLAILANKVFGELVKLEPSLSALPSRLRDEALLITPTVFVGDVESTCSDPEP